MYLPEYTRGMFNPSGARENGNGHRSQKYLSFLSKPMDLQLFPDGSEHSFGCFHSFRFFDLSSYFLYTSADMSTLEHPRFSTLIQDQRDILFSHSTDISGLLGNPLLGWAFWKAVHAEHEKREKIGLEVVAWKTVVQNMQYMKLLH